MSDKRKVELVIRVNGNESFYELPSGLDPATDTYLALDAEVEEVIRCTEALKDTLNTSVLRILLVNASIHGKRGPIEIVLGEDNQPGIKNPETGEVLWL